MEKGSLTRLLQDEGQKLEAVDRLQMVRDPKFFLMESTHTNFSFVILQMAFNIVRDVVLLLSTI
jgi:hypothetical protein